MPGCAVLPPEGPADSFYKVAESTSMSRRFTGTCWSIRALARTWARQQAGALAVFPALFSGRCQPMPWCPPAEQATLMILDTRGHYPFLSLWPTHLFPAPLPTTFPFVFFPPCRGTLHFVYCVVSPHASPLLVLTILSYQPQIGTWSLSSSFSDHCPVQAPTAPNRQEPT